MQHPQVADNIQDGVQGCEMVVRDNEGLDVGHELHPGQVMTVATADIEDMETARESYTIAGVHDKMFTWT